MKQDSQVPGLNEFSRIKRTRRNIVTMKFNMINWILETLIVLSTLSTTALLQHILFTTSVSLGTPLVYVLGIEENRKLAREQFKRHIRIFKKKNQIQQEDNEIDQAQEMDLFDVQEVIPNRILLVQEISTIH